MNRRITPLSSINFPACVKFLLAQEHRCVSLVSTITENGKPFFQKKTVSSFTVLSRTAPDGTQILDGVIYLSPGGTLLHLLTNAADATEYTSSIRYWLKDRRIHCVLGTAEGNRTMESIITKKFRRTVNYDLMILSKTPQATAALLPQIPEPSPLAGKPPSIRRACQQDENILLPLQLGYEKEEVMGPNDSPDTSRTRTSLRLSLAHQHIYAGFYGDEVIGKAGTNACGVYWNQLGGIYTHPDYRGRGIASALIAHVVRKETDEGKRVCLFVKTSNVYAKKAYTRVGFVPDCAFRIAYY